MIEAVNSVLSNASVSRQVAEQQSTVRSTAANPNRIQEAAAGRAPYVSPAISIDRESNRAIIQIRDSDTGDVVRQFPTEGQLKAYRQAQEFSSRQEAAVENELRRATGAETTTPSQQSSSPVETATVTTASASSAPAPSTSVETEA